MPAESLKATCEPTWVDFASLALGDPLTLLPLRVKGGRPPLQPPKLKKVSEGNYTTIYLAAEEFTIQGDRTLPHQRRLTVQYYHITQIV